CFQLRLVLGARGQSRARVRHGFFQLGKPVVAAEMVAVEIAGNGEEISLYRGFADLAARRPGAHEGFRSNIVRQGGISAEKQREAMHLRRVTLVESMEVKHRQSES